MQKIQSTHDESITFPGATEDAINQAREAFHAHLASTKRAQQAPDYTDEELLMEERDFEQDYAGPSNYYSVFDANLQTMYLNI